MWADNQTKVTVECFPINSFGQRIPLRKISVKFKFVEGKELIDILSINESEGRMIIKSKLIEGKVVIKIISKYSLLPNLIEITILKNLS